MRTIYLSFLLLFVSGCIYAQNETNKKLELELSGSESINASLSFKFGTTNIYGIVSGGMIRFHKPNNSAIGLGLGTQRLHQNGWTNEIELLAYTMNKNGSFKGDLSMLSQLKLTIGKQIAPHFKIYCGPVVNLSILKDKDENGNFSNDIAPYSILGNKKENSKIDSWIGISAGVRF